MNTRAANDPWFVKTIGSGRLTAPPMLGKESALKDHEWHHRNGCTPRSCNVRSVIKSIVFNHSSSAAIAARTSIEECQYLVKLPLRYLATGILSYLAVTILEELAAELQGRILRTEIYSIHGFSHVFFGLGLASAVLFWRPKSGARVVMLVVLIGAIVWELYEGLWLAGEPLDSIEDVMLAMLSAYAFLCWERRDNSQHPTPLCCVREKNGVRNTERKS
jgi:hypothetical protein